MKAAKGKFNKMRFAANPEFIRADRAFILLKALMRIQQYKEQFPLKLVAVSEKRPT